MCLPTACAEEGAMAPAATDLSPVARDYPSRAHGGFFRPPHCDCSIKEREPECGSLMKKKGIVLHNFSPGETGE